MDALLWGSVHAVADAASQLAPSGTPGEAFDQRTGNLERRIEKLSLVCQALWSLVKDHAGATEADLARRVEELDLTDGRLDGRLSPFFVCAACNRKSARRHERCLYCGATRKGLSPFDTV